MNNIMKKLLQQIKDFLWIINPIDMPVTYFTIIMILFFIIYVGFLKYLIVLLMGTIIYFSILFLFRAYYRWRLKKNIKTLNKAVEHLDDKIKKAVKHLDDKIKESDNGTVL